MAGSSPHAADLAPITIQDLFAADPTRAETLTIDAAGLHADLSKNRIDHRTVELLCALARQSELTERRDAMFAGSAINTTEDRSVLHTALRRSAGDELTVDGADVVADVHAVLDQMSAFAEQVRSGGGPGPPAKRSLPW